MKEETLDLQDRLTEVQNRIDDLEAEQDAVEADADSLPSDDDLDDEDRAEEVAETRSALREEYIDLEEDIRALKKTEGVIRQKISEWNGSEFTIRAFTFGDQAQANDLFLQDLKESGKTSPEEGFNARKIRIVQVGVRDKPTGAPEHPRGFPPSIGEWLYEAIEDLNTYGEVGLDDFSLPSTLKED